MLANFWDCSLFSLNFWREISKLSVQVRVHRTSANQDNPDHQFWDLSLSDIRSLILDINDIFDASDSFADCFHSKGEAYARSQFKNRRPVFGPHAAEFSHWDPNFADCFHSNGVAYARLSMAWYLHPNGLSNDFFIILAACDIDSPNTKSTF